MVDRCQSSSDTKKSGISRFDTSTAEGAAPTSSNSSAGSKLLTQAAGSKSMKKSASSLASALISSFGSGSSSTSTPGTSSSAANGTDQAPGALSKKSRESSTLSWHGSNNVSPSVTPPTASFTEPGTSVASRIPSKQCLSGRSSGRLLPDAVFVPEHAAQCMSSTNILPDRDFFLNASSSFGKKEYADIGDSDGEDDGNNSSSQLLRSSTGNLSFCSRAGGRTSGAASPIRRLGSSSLVVHSPGSLLMCTPNASTAGLNSISGQSGGISTTDNMARQASRVSFLMYDAYTTIGASNSGSSGKASGNSNAGSSPTLGRPDMANSGNEDLVAAAGVKKGSSYTAYKRCHTTALTDSPESLSPGRCLGSPSDPNNCHKASGFKSSIAAAFNKLSLAVSFEAGSNKGEANAYKYHHGYLPSPSASSAGSNIMLENRASGKASSLSRASSLSSSKAAAAGIVAERSGVNAKKENEGDEDSPLAPALPPGVIPLFGTRPDSNSSNHQASSPPAVEAAAATAVPSSPGGGGAAPMLSGASKKALQSPFTPGSAVPAPALQSSVVQVPKTLSLAPAGQTGPVRLAVSPRLIPAMQREVWCLGDFVIHKKLYEGYASTICKAFDRISGTIVAIKLYHMSKLNSISSHQVAREVRLHIGLDHENIIALYAAFQEAGNVVLVQEFAAGGDLWSFIDANSGRLTERVTVSLVLQPFLRALQYLHTAGIAHRDIKPENVLFNSNMVLKVADFGLAVNLREERAVTRVGTLDYMAPEVLRCPLKRHPNDNKDRTELYYSQAVDAWAVGVLAFELMTGRAPFSASGASDSAIEAAIQSALPTFPSRMSEPAKEFIALALNKSPDRRPDILQMLHHPWIWSFQRSSSNGRAERGSQDYGGQGRLLIPAASTIAQAQAQRQQQQPSSPPALPPLSAKNASASRKELYGSNSSSSSAGPGSAAAAAAAGVYHSDDNGMTGYAVSGVGR